MTYDPKLVHLPGTRLTPAVVLHRTLDKIDRIKGVVVIIQWDDDTWDMDWSNMEMHHLCFASQFLSAIALREIEKCLPK